MSYLKIIYFYFMSVFATIFFSTLVIVTGFFRRLGLVKSPNRQVEHYFASLWAKTVIKLMPGWNVAIVGLENIPKKLKPCVIVANHESLADIWMLYLINIQFKWLSKIENFKIPLMGAAMTECGYIAIHRGNKESTNIAMEQSAAWLKRGVPMLFFPEGTRTKTPGIIGDFKLGAFKLALTSAVPILPIALSGAGDLIRKGSKVPQDANIVIKILPLQYPKADETVEAWRDHVRTLVVDAHKEISLIRRQSQALSIKDPIEA